MGTGRRILRISRVAGPIALAQKYLEDEDLFFVFNR